MGWVLGFEFWGWADMTGMALDQGPWDWSRVIGIWIENPDGDG
jgi:hypothetical protein